LAGVAASAGEPGRVVVADVGGAASAPAAAAPGAAGTVSASVAVSALPAQPALAASAPRVVPETLPIAAAAAVAPPADGPVQLRTAEASWVEARDAGGRVLLSRLLSAGERLALDGALPVRLTIGNARGTELSFRGQRVDLSPRTRDNVARVELPVGAAPAP
jgi:cytoskeleton protein RodZ